MDRGYNILLSQLHNPSKSLPLPTIQGTLAHYLSIISPLPTPLAATAISSPLFLLQPFTNLKLQTFQTVFRHATQLKYRALMDATKTRSKMRMMLGRSRESVLGQWVTDVLTGIQGGHSILRLAACSGLLLGVEDVKKSQEEFVGIDVGNARFVVEDEAVVALAEVMDRYSSTSTTAVSEVTTADEWEKEFQPAGQDILSIAMIVASQSLPLVAQHRLEALPLPALATLLMSTIASTFKQGTFLANLSSSVTLSPENQIQILASSPIVQTLHSLSSSPLSSSIAQLSKFAAKVLSILLDSQRASSRTDNLYTVSDLLDLVREMAKTIERDWLSSPLSNVTDEQDIAQSSQEVCKTIWTTLKTFLFTTVMLSDAVLTAVIYANFPPCDITPATLALQALHTLSHLSFVIFEFGGVTTTIQGFENLNKTFYLALDILAKSKNGRGSQAELYVQQSCLLLKSMQTEGATTKPIQAKEAFVLASIARLVPVLSNKCIRDWVWDFCYPHLYDLTHRQTYELAHSVILAIFAHYPDRQQQLFISGQSSPGSGLVRHRNTAYSGISKPGQMNEDVSEESMVSAKFMQQLVPFYVKCLIDNSKDGQLNTAQLRLAFSALVRGARPTNISVATATEASSLAWYCVQVLLDTIQELSPSTTTTDPSGRAEGEVSERLHRLHLMLISAAPSLPQSLMLRCLDHIRDLIISVYPMQMKMDAESGASAAASAIQRKKMELVEALFRELVERIDNQDKGVVMSWWYKNLPRIVTEEEKIQAGGVVRLDEEASTAGQKETEGLSSSSLLQSRL